MSLKLKIPLFLIALAQVPLVSALEIVKKQPLTKQTQVNVEVKQKKPNGCKAFGNAIRNIRTVKELQRELNNYSEATVKECINDFKNDRRIMSLFQQLDKLNRTE
jgi:ABC-type bacteriocin/lantibiotic exporter with double-glycine peptidase domain